MKPGMAEEKSDRYPLSLVDSINEYRQTTKMFDLQPEPQNPHLKPLDPVCKVHVQGTHSKITKMADIKSVHPAGLSACVCRPQKSALPLLVRPLIPTVPLICSSCWCPVSAPAMSLLVSVLCFGYGSGMSDGPVFKRFKLHKLFKEHVGYQHLNTDLYLPFLLLINPCYWDLGNLKPGA